MNHFNQKLTIALLNSLCVYVLASTASAQAAPTEANPLAAKQPAQATAAKNSARNSYDLYIDMSTLSAQGVKSDSAEFKKLKAAYDKQNKIDMEAHQKFKEANYLPQTGRKACGAAALANLLTFYYDAPHTEQALLQSINTEGTVALNMKDINTMAQKAGFKMAGYRLSETDLKRLKQPIILRVEGALRDESRQFARIAAKEKAIAEGRYTTLALREEQRAAAKAEMAAANQTKSAATTQTQTTTDTAAQAIPAQPALDPAVAKNNALKLEDDESDSEGHFVILEKIVNDVAYVKDPMRGNKRVAFTNLVKAWRGSTQDKGVVLGVVGKT